jgi:ATP-binding cassette subfamily B multidrug efflux pump
MHSLSRAVRYLRLYWLTATGAVISLLLVSAANLVFPQIVRHIIDGGIEGGDMQIIVGGAPVSVGLCAHLHARQFHAAGAPPSTV